MSVRITPLTRTLPENCAAFHLLWLPQNQLQYTRRKKPRKQYWAYFGGGGLQLYRHICALRDIEGIDAADLTRAGLS